MPKYIRQFSHEYESREREIGILQDILLEWRNLEAVGTRAHDYFERLNHLEGRSLGLGLGLDEVEAGIDQRYGDLLRLEKVLDWQTMQRELWARIEYENDVFNDACHELEPVVGDVVEELQSADRYEELYSYLKGDGPAPHWRRSEEAIAQLFKDRGCEAQLGPGRADGGVDIRLMLQSPVGSLLTLVQVKDYMLTRKVGLEAVAALSGVVDAEKANKGVFVTTSAFQPAARKFADTMRNRLLLVDGPQLLTWIEEVRLGRRGRR
ncbi:MAG: restriction endonuclease [Actinomycetota bacterium]|nr:restriction endonuclease [Actinomycetota bacterium]